MLRTHTCGELRKKDLGKTVTLAGWLHSIRSHGKLFFIDLRDRYGLTQCVINAEKDFEFYKSLKKESVLLIKGKVQERISGQKNKDMLTGDIELKISKLDVLTKSEQTPFKVEDDVIANEDLRLKYRYLDMRRTPVKEAIITRHKVVKAIRDYLDNYDFLEIETPFLGKSTPEGARDFLVPSRVHPGKFYALPQSPQIYKQLFMVSGLDKYFQIVRCFRDEDLRADRQNEFTQMDLEMSFLEEEDIYKMIEGMMASIWQKVHKVKIKTPFLRMTYKESMERFGVDAPDMRFKNELQDYKDFFKKCGFNILESAKNVKGIKFKGSLDKKQLKKVESEAKRFKAKGMISLTNNNGIEGPIAKFLNKETLAKLEKEIKKGETLLLVGDDNRHIVNESLGKVRNLIGDIFNLKGKEFKFCWVTKFPLFELNEEGRVTSVHHPFTSPQPDHLKFLEDKPLEVLSVAYDLVINGTEIGGGSIRIHDPEIQQRIFKVLGLTDERIKINFGFLTEAFKYGAPPHGGIALGVDRLVAMIADKPSLRDVIAFPKTKDAEGLLEGTPTLVTKDQLDELHISSKKK